MASITPSVVGTGSKPATTAPAAVPAVSASLATTAMALSVLKTLAQSDRLADSKPTIAALSTAIPVHKPVATAASVTKMETTAVSRSGPEQKPQTVSVIAELNLAQKDTAQKPAILVKSPPLSDNLQSKPAVTILDFADMMMPQGANRNIKTAPFSTDYSFKAAISFFSQQDNFVTEGKAKRSIVNSPTRFCDYYNNNFTSNPVVHHFTCTNSNHHVVSTKNNSFLSRSCSEHQSFRIDGSICRESCGKRVTEQLH